MGSIFDKLFLSGKKNPPKIQRGCLTHAEGEYFKRINEVHIKNDDLSNFQSNHFLEVLNQMNL